MAAKGEPSARLNRIYIRQADIAKSLYRRRKEFGFTTEDVMRLHWDRGGRRALSWARTIIKRMRYDGIIETKPKRPEGDGRRRLYTFTKEALETWRLFDPAAYSAAQSSSSEGASAPTRSRSSPSPGTSP